MLLGAADNRQAWVFFVLVKSLLYRYAVCYKTRRRWMGSHVHTPECKLDWQQSKHVHMSALTFNNVTTTAFIISDISNAAKQFKHLMFASDKPKGRFGLSSKIHDWSRIRMRAFSIFGSGISTATTLRCAKIHGLVLFQSRSLGCKAIRSKHARLSGSVANPSQSANSLLNFDQCMGQQREGI